MISQEKAAGLAAKYQTTPAFIERVAAFVELTARGVNDIEALREVGVTPNSSLSRYRSWAKQIGPELAEPETASELATPSGDVLADTAVRPAWGPWTAAEDPEAHRDQADYSDTPNDEGDDQQ